MCPASVTLSIKKISKIIYVYTLINNNFVNKKITKIMNKESCCVCGGIVNLEGEIEHESIYCFMEFKNVKHKIRYVNKMQDENDKGNNDIIDDNIIIINP